MKRSFTLLEIILVLLLMSILYVTFLPKTNLSKINDVTNRLILQLKFLRYKSLIDYKYNLDDQLWHKKRWTLKFFRCRKDIGGIYYSIYSDKNKSGHPGINDSLKDPLSQKNIYSTNHCSENIKNSKYVLLTKNFDIKNIDISCNETKSLGQISFGNNGKVYTKLSNEYNDSSSYELKDICFIKLTDKFNNTSLIKIEPNTTYINRIIE